MEAIKVLVAEDQEILRAGLRLTLDAFVGITVVGEAEDGMACIDLVKTVCPDIILMDIVMPRMNGIDATQQIKSINPDIRIIMFTSFSRDEDIFAAFAAGADAYCLKDIESEQLELAIRTAATGALYMDLRVAQRVFAVLASPTTGRPHSLSLSKRESLSSRELEVLRLVVDGLSNAKIAARLTISVETAKSHVRNIMGKLQVSDRTQAAIKAIRDGLVDKDG